MEHMAAATLREIARLVDAGAPVPTNVDLVGYARRAELQITSNAVGDVDRWAELLGATTGHAPRTIASNQRPWRPYEAHAPGTDDRWELRVWCAHDVTATASNPAPHATPGGAS